MSRPAPTLPIQAPPPRARGLELPLRTVALGLGITLVYALACGLGMLLARPGSELSVFWPAAGVALAAVIRLGSRAWISLIVAACAVAIGYFGTLTSVVILLGSVAGAGLGGWLIRRRGRSTLRFNRVTDVGYLALAAVVLATASAAIAAVVLMISGQAHPSAVGREAVAWWLAHVAGALLAAPLLLRPARRERAVGSRVLRVEAIVSWAGLAMCAAVAVWFTFAPGVLRFPATTACLPLLAISAVRFGPRGAALANLFTAAVVVGIVLIARRPEFNLALMAFLAVSSITALSLGAVTAERDVALARMVADIAARVAAESARQAAETERILAEAALEADRKRSAALLEHSHDTIVVMSPEGRTAYVSDAITRLTGRTPDDLLGRFTFENVHPDDRPRVESAFADCLAHPGVVGRAEFRFRTLEDRWVWLEAIGTNHVDNPVVGGVVVNIRDVTERRQAEDRLREARALLEVTGRLARIGGWEYIIPEDRLIWSEQTYRIHDVTPGQYTPTVIDAIDFYAPEGRPLIRDAMMRAMVTGEPWNLVLPFITDTGRRLWVNAIGHVELHNGKPHRLYGTFQDVTERVESERAVQESEARYQNLFESAPVAIWEEDLTAIAEWFDSLRAGGVTDLAAHLAANPGLVAVVARMIRARDVNPAAVAMNRAADKADLITNLQRLFTSETLAAITNELVGLWNGERTLRVEGRIARLDGTPADIELHMRVPEVDGRPDFTRVVVIILDVTDQKRLEEQVRQSQKLEAVGRLAGGIAHDFNNLLTVINGFAELIVADTSSVEGIRDLASHIRDAGNRAADLTRQLLAFSRKQPAATGPIEPAAVVGGLCPLLVPLVGSAIRLITQLKPVPAVRIDKGQLEQVVMNLVINARDAMPSGGTVTVSTDVAETEPHAGADLPVGRWVLLTVADTGTGIREEVRPHLFEPFFTTKEIGRGTGLGLSTVYGIVTRAGGHVRFDTAPGRGTTFRVYLPVVTSQSDQKPTANEPAPVATGPGTSPSDAGSTAVASGRILLAEDLPSVRTLTEQILAGAGFAVTAAADGDEALRLLTTMPKPPDVLVTDVQMPGMDGRDLAARIRTRHPEVQVLFISGYAPDSQPAGVNKSDYAFLAKPFSPDELIQSVRALVK